MSDFINILQETNSWNILLFIGVEILFWMVISAILILFLPRKYRIHKKEIFLFFLIMNVGLLVMGVVITLVMLLFGLSMATSRIHKPRYEMINFEEYTSSFPMVHSKFHEGILAIGTKHNKSISTDQKIKSLKILYNSNAQGNIGKIKLFLSDSSDETRLYAFALISASEQKLNGQIKEIKSKIDKCKDKKKLEEHQYNLAIAYWQFIFHGIANEHMVLFYTKKIEEILQEISHRANASILLGKIHLFNKRYFEAEEAFKRAIELGVNESSVATFLAEAKYEQREYSEVSKYMQNEEFTIDLRMKPLYEIWKENK
ncbi:Extracellular Matrix protein PelE [hydrothermal vent metagenome]|uniref:Extracellular Matrix protein PelE n=1 Tax=hydrothermal vent metagenome TaxID=652676 RepID=A0A1W1B9W9_9ZZZZ